MAKRQILGPAMVLLLATMIARSGSKGSNGLYQGESQNRAKRAEPPAPIVPAGKTLSYNFDSDAAGKLPAGFHSALTGQGREGSWIVREDETAPSKPNALAQTSTDDTSYRFPMAILDEARLKDLDMSVKFKAISGSVDQAGGLVFRYRDHDNYYVVRANALEDNYRLYHVVDGRRRQFASASFRVTPNEWHVLRVECIGNQIRCYYDGELKIAASDETFKEAGKVGLWTKADSVTHFDDFTITAR